MSSGHKNCKILSTTSLLKGREGISLNETEVKETFLSVLQIAKLEIPSFYGIVNIVRLLFFRLSFRLIFSQ